MGQPIEDIKPSNSPAAPARAREEFKPLTRGATDFRGQPLIQATSRFHSVLPDVKRRYNEATTFDLPFQCSWNKSAGTISILGGTYQVGPSTINDVAPTEATAGDMAYLCIQQDADNAVVAVTPVVTSVSKDPTNLDIGGTFVEWSNVLLAEVVGTGDDAYLAQRRHGNFILTQWGIDGFVARWAETLVGSIPP